MTDSTAGIDRLTKGLTLIGASLSSVWAINPLAIPVESKSFAALTALIITGYGLVLAVTSAPSIAALERIVPEQYH